MTSTTAGPSSVTATSMISLLTNLPIVHPSFSTLLSAHTPFAATSSVSTSALNKLLGRIDTAILSKENESERRAAWIIANEVLRQDAEGYTLQQHGKGWVTAALAALTAPQTPLSAVVSPLNLLLTLMTTSSFFPSFEREAIHPIMGKTAVTLSRLIERSVQEGQNDWQSTLEILTDVRVVLEHSPAPFRPVATNIKQALRVITLSLPTLSIAQASVTIPLAAPLEVRQAAADLNAALPNTAGKAQSSGAWGTAVREALGGISVAMNAIVQDGWEEEPMKVTPPLPPSGLPSLPEEPGTRLQASLDWLEGFTEELVALLRYPTARPVPVPIAQIVAAGLRCLNLTLDTPTVAYVNPQHRAALMATLPRIWTSGLLLIGSLAASCGDHLFPHLSVVLDHTVWLTERTPLSISDTHIQLLAFHRLLFEQYPPALVPVDYPSRLLRFCLAQFAPILDARPGVLSNAPEANGKRGKKRARGAEDGLIGGLEGREAKAIPSTTVDRVIASLQLVSLLHPTPLLRPSLLTFSIRLNLALHLHLASTSKSAFVDPLSKVQLQDAVSKVLGQALYITEGEQGTARGWKTAILAVLDTRSEAALSLLHPSLPPLNRPQPPLNALHFFTKETEEERKLRKELGYLAVGEDPVEDGGDEAEMEVETTASQPVIAEAVETTTIRAFPAFKPIIPHPLIPVPAVTASQPQNEPVISLSQKEATPESEQLTGDATASAEREAIEETMEVEEMKDTPNPFVAASLSKGKGRADIFGEPVAVTTPLGGEEDDEPLPELDSGSSDEEEDDEEEEEEEEVEAGKE